MTTETKPDLGTPSDHWPPVAHLRDKRDPDSRYAICGAKLMGIELDDAEKVCVKCLEEMKRREGLA